MSFKELHILDVIAVLMVTSLLHFCCRVIPFKVSDFLHPNGCTQLYQPSYPNGGQVKKSIIGRIRTRIMINTATFRLGGLTYLSPA